MKNELIFDIEKELDGTKIREYLRKKEFSTRFIRSAAGDKRIRVNGKIAKLSYVLREADKLQIQVSKVEDQNIEPEKIDIEVVYEDEDVIVINKPPGIVVHPTKSYPSGTLANGILYYFREKGENCIVRLVSRLDMDTSGLILVAKNQFSHMSLARDMQSETFKKGYLAITHNNSENHGFKESSGTIDLPIYRPGDGEIIRVIDDRGQRSITHYEVLETYEEGQLLKLMLETGRTHQIRVHLSYLGHPIYGDALYGKEEQQYIKRQALHAYMLHFPHPRTREVVKLETDLPQDMKVLITNLKDIK
ncbi:MAG: RluA family pseudouridine synthase [Bacillota bacterium]|nr:RluA family pseudouridine synthase [Bacillota bacterium]